MDGKRSTVLLTMPRNGRIEPDSAEAFYSTCSEKHQITVGWSKTSLLTLGFNQLWCHALNNPHDYFAMLHADVTPDTYWLDTLIDILEDRELDILSTYIAVKNDSKLTSTAIDNADHWSPTNLKYHSGTLSDSKLLINTGCWVAKCGDWMEKIVWHIENKIVKEDGIWKPLVVPEDWNFSRQCHDLGLKIGVTGKVRVRHIGEKYYDIS